jgi:hypothetical protein
MSPLSGWVLFRHSFVSYLTFLQSIALETLQSLRSCCAGSVRKQEHLPVTAQLFQMMVQELLVVVGHALSVVFSI